MIYMYTSKQWYLFIWSKPMGDISNIGVFTLSGWWGNSPHHSERALCFHSGVLATLCFYLKKMQKFGNLVIKNPKQIYTVLCIWRLESHVFSRAQAKLGLIYTSFNIYSYSISGFLQFIGCLGALRLSEKLLNTYWLLLLFLLIGDAVIGVFWMLKFDRILQEIQPMLR